MRWVRLWLLTLILVPAARAQLPVASPAYEVDLTWDAPSVSVDPVATYDVYVSFNSGQSYELTGTVTSTQLEYIDQSSYVQQGLILTYIVESVDANGNESVPSNSATVVMPGSTQASLGALVPSS